MPDQFLCFFRSILLSGKDHHLEVTCVLGMAQNTQVLPFPRRELSRSIVLRKLFFVNLASVHVFDHSNFIWKICEFLSIDAAAFPDLDYRSEVEWSKLTQLLVRSLIPIYHLPQVSPHGSRIIRTSLSKLFAPIRYWSVITELIDGNDGAKDQLCCV